MYHHDIVANRIQAAENRFGFRLHRYDPDESLWITQQIDEKHRDHKSGQLTNLPPDLQLFIHNEILLSRCDFRYFTRYLRVLGADAEGKEKPFNLWSTQDRFLRKIADTELAMYRQLTVEKRKMFAGNRWVCHKRGQGGISTFVQALGVHLTNFYSGINSLCASTNEDKVKELDGNYASFMWSRLPSWMHTATTKNNQDEGKAFVTGSKFVLQNSDQQTGLGQGAKWHWSHLTECASWDKNRIVDQIENHYMPRIHFSWGAMAFLESTSQGFKDWWHLTTERVRSGNLNFWQYFFVPWYAVHEVTYAYPPDGWKPKPETLKERDLIERTSPEWMDGETKRLSPPEMYYWESTRHNYEANGALAQFYKSYPSTPDQSFVQEGRASFPLPVILGCEQQCVTPQYYDIVTDYNRDRFLPETREWRWYTIDKTTIAPIRTSPEERNDPRGLILLFEPPDERLHNYHTYAGVDAAGGAIDWTRFLRRKEDDDLDNASLQIIRHTANLDVQIAAFKAPVTPNVLAKYFNILGRLYPGANATDKQTPTIVELSSHGLAFQDEMINRYGWINWYEHVTRKEFEYKETGKMGWPPTGMTQRILWANGKQRICDAQMLIRSLSTVAEMRACTDDWLQLAGMIRGKAKKGYHDDDVYALMLAIWYANDPTNPLSKAKMVVGRPQPTIAEGQEWVPPNRRSWLPEERERFWDEWDSRMMEGIEL